MRRLLVLGDVRSLTSTQLTRAILEQTQHQSSNLANLRFRRPEINDVFSSISKSNILDATDPEKRYQWAETSRAHLSAAFERLAADGLKWGGNLANNLNEPLNQVCSHSLHGLMCFDMLLALLEHEKTHPEALLSETLGRDIDIQAMLENSVIPDMESLTKEKFGACPEVHVSMGSPKPLLGYGDPALLSFVFVELLKNSLETVLNRYGVLDLDDAESDGALVTVTLERHADADSLGSITVSDRGMGLQQSAETGFNRFLDAFYSTSPSRSREPSYHYSRMFGAPYSGAGMGLLKSKVYLKFHGATLSLGPNPSLKDGSGTAVSIRFDGR